jgi:hypothetical protein
MKSFHPKLQKRFAELSISMEQNDSLLNNIAETAYRFIEDGCYGSFDNAVKALLKRKGVSLTKEEAAEKLNTAITILKKTVEMREMLTKKYNLDSVFMLDEDKILEGWQIITETLSKDYPESRVTIEYMIFTEWILPCVR